jgi:hypothetical protein
LPVHNGLRDRKRIRFGVSSLRILWNGQAVRRPRKRAAGTGPP